MNSGFSLRGVAMEDARLLYAWRNDPETRAASRNSDTIDWTEHQIWLLRSLASPDRVIRIAVQEGTPVGVVRADRTSEGWELSWTLAPELRGRGFGGQMVRIFAAGLEGSISAVVRQGYRASERVAIAAGLRRVGPASAAGFDLWART